MVLWCCGAVVLWCCGAMRGGGAMRSGAMRGGAIESSSDAYGRW